MGMTMGQIFLVGDFMKDVFAHMRPFLSELLNLSQKILKRIIIGKVPARKVVISANITNFL